MRKKIVVIVGLIIGLSIIALSTIQSTSDINEDVIIVNNKNLEVFYFNNLDPENPYNQDFSILSDKQINQLKKEFIQREVLVREAKRLGLDKIDSIISARLAQLGQQALVGEIIEFEDIEFSEINDFFETNKSQYIESETISFSHIFFDTEESAKSYLLKLQKESDVEKIKNHLEKIKTENLRLENEIQRLNFIIDNFIREKEIHEITGVQEILKKKISKKKSKPHKKKTIDKLSFNQENIKEFIKKWNQGYTTFEITESLKKVGVDMKGTKKKSFKL